jgi:phage tail sheath protein FI
MPQYLAPGVYVEEIPGPRSIQGVSTSTAAFVGPTRFGPTSGRPELLTSYADFVRIYGDAADLVFADGVQVPNYLALGAKGFFDEGGSSLYVARTFRHTGGKPVEAHHGFALIAREDPENPDPTLVAADKSAPDAAADPDASADPNAPADESAEATIDDPDATAEHDATAVAPEIGVRARFPGAAGDLRVILTLRAGTSALANGGLTRVREFDTVWATPTSTSSGAGAVYVVRRDPATGLLYLAGAGTALDLSEVSTAHPLTVLVEVQRPSTDASGLPTYGPPQAIGEFGFDPRSATGISNALTVNPATRRDALTAPIALENVSTLAESAGDPDAVPGLVAVALLGSTILQTAPDATAAGSSRQRVVALSGGSDGAEPTAAQYEGSETFADYQNNPVALPFHGLLALEAVDDISIVAAPGGATGWTGDAGATAAGQAINGAVISHCERLVYRTAALDTPANFLPDDALDYRNQRSSTHAALYYPWITVSHPIDGSRISVPPAAYLAGIWARSDNARGVFKAPANEVVRSALDLEIRLNKAQQELLNPQGVDCLRFFPGRGFLVWGARTVSDDPEWKYLSVRRYFNYLEKSVDAGTQWVVFEVNGPALWDSVRHTVEGFLLSQWKSGALLGAKPEEAFFVRCDATTMTADDLDNGRLICVIGVAVAKPAEFVIFRISQFTATPTA